MLTPAKVTWGTDPEAFFQREGQIIGSERIIPEEGFVVPGGKIVRDGVQFELNPLSSDRIVTLGANIGLLFRHVSRTLQLHPDVSCNFDGLVEVNREELSQLSPATRQLGCMPSYNMYGPKPITVDPLTYPKRSSGGHIHMGLSIPIFNPFYKKLDNRQRLVPLCDIFIGNTSVLLDRDPGAAERRENYGRAGEYRLPPYGLEYRTTSNFWLRDYTLMSFAMGMASIAVSVLSAELLHNNIERELIEVVNIRRVQDAINTNNFELAKQNFDDIRPFLAKHLPPMGFPLNPTNIDKFLMFADSVNRDGIEAYIPTENIIRNWCLADLEEFDAFLARL